MFHYWAVARFSARLFYILAALESKADAFAHAKVHTYSQFQLKRLSNIGVIITLRIVKSEEK
jgi:hypothetical protein